MSKVALITGASRGIGKAICAHLALEGFSIAVTARSVSENDMTPYPGTIHETAALVESMGGRALPIRCDVGEPDDIEGAVEKTLEAFGRLDVMINNARYEGPANWEKIEDLEWSAISTAIDCNFKAPLMFMRLLIPQMAKQGGGLFINVTTGIEGAPAQPEHAGAGVDEPPLPQHQGGPELDDDADRQGGAGAQHRRRGAPAGGDPSRACDRLQGGGDGVQPAAPPLGAHAVRRRLPPSHAGRPHALQRGRSSWRTTSPSSTA